jgi:hypothetical protein
MMIAVLLYAYARGGSVFADHDRLCATATMQLSSAVDRSRAELRVDVVRAAGEERRRWRGVGRAAVLHAIACAPLPARRERPPSGRAGSTSGRRWPSRNCSFLRRATRHLHGYRDLALLDLARNGASAERLERPAFTQQRYRVARGCSLAFAYLARSRRGDRAQGGRVRVDEPVARLQGGTVTSNMPAGPTEAR